MFRYFRRIVLRMFFRNYFQYFKTCAILGLESNVTKYNGGARITVRATRDNHSNRVELCHGTKRGANHFKIDSGR